MDLAPSGPEAALDFVASTPFIADTTRTAGSNDRPNHMARGNAGMDKDRIEGVEKKVKGSVKEAVGKVTGDSKTQAEGKAEKTAGRAQNAVGGAKDSARDLLKE